MSDIFLDSSAGTNGDGSAASPFNTHVGMGEATGDTVWIRRDTTNTLAANWTLVTGVDYYGYPNPGEAGYVNRPVVAAWDADAVTKPIFISTTNKYIYINTPKIHLYNTRIVSSTGSKVLYTVTAHGLILDNIEVESTVATGGQCLYMTGAAHGVTIKKLVVKVVQLTSSYSQCPTIINCDYSSVEVKYIIAQPRTSQLFGSTLMNLDNCTATRVTIDVVLLSVDKYIFNIGRFYNGDKNTIIVRSVTDNHPDTVIGLGDTGKLEYLYIRSRNICFVATPTSQPTTRICKFMIEADKIAGAPVSGTGQYSLVIPRYSTVVIKPYTPGNTIVLEDGTQGFSIYMSYYTLLTIEKAMGVNVKSYSPIDRHVYWTDETGTWKGISGHGEMYSSAISRTGGGPQTIRAEINTVTAVLGTDIYPIRLGVIGAELIAIELVAGTHEITTYGALNKNGSDLSVTAYSQQIVWCDEGMENTELTIGAIDDDSAWTGDTGLTSFKLTSTIVLSTPMTVYVRLNVYTPYVPGTYTYLDMTPVVVSS